LFANREDVDFENVNEIKPLQVVENLAVDFEGAIDNPLVQARFNNVDSVVLHVQGAVGEDELSFYCVGFKGESRGLSRKVVEGIKYEVRAQLKDHPKTKSEQSGGVA
jgi:hypothetical protein